MKRMIIVLISLILGTFCSFAEAEENIINYDGANITIDASGIGDVEFSENENFTLVENQYGIFAYIDFKGKFIGRNAAGKLINKYRMIMEDDFVKKITVSEYNPDTIRISIKLQKKENLICAYDPESAKIYIGKETTISKNIETEKEKEIEKSETQEVQEIEKAAQEIKEIEDAEEMIEKEFSILKKVEWNNDFNSLNLSFDSILSRYEIVNDGFDHLVVFDLESGVDYKVSRTINNFQNPYLKKIRIQQFDPRTLRVVFHVTDPDIFFDINNEKGKITFSFDNFSRIAAATGKNQEKEKDFKTEEKAKSEQKPLLKKLETDITVKDIIEYLPNNTATGAADESANGKEKTDAANKGIEKAKPEIAETGVANESADGKEKKDAVIKSVEEEVSTEQEISSFSFGSGSEGLDSDVEELFTDISETEEQEKKRISFSGQAEVYAAKDFQEEDYEDAEAFNSSLILKIDYYPKNKNISADASIKILQDSNSPEDKVKADIWETSLDYKKKIGDQNLKLSLGKKIVRFGKTDEISPIDNVNPEDLRFFVTKDYDERKIPVWMASAETEILGWRSGLFYIPFFQEAKIHQFGNDWSVFGHFKDELAGQGLPFYDSLVKNISVTEIMPDKSLPNGEFAASFKKTFGALDTEFVYSYTYNDMPFYAQIPDILKGQAPEGLQNFILDYRNRSHLLGFAAEGSLKDFGLRAEAAWSSDRPFLRENFESYASDVFHFIIGADYSYLDWYFNLQYSHEINIGNMSKTIYSEKNNQMVLGQIAYGNIFDNALGKKYKIGADFSAGLNNYSVFAKPYAKYYFDGGLSLEAFANLFYGDRGTMMGDKKDASEYGMKLAYSF